MFLFDVRGCKRSCLLSGLDALWSPHSGSPYDNVPATTVRRGEVGLVGSESA